MGEDEKVNVLDGAQSLRLSQLSRLSSGPFDVSFGNPTSHTHLSQAKPKEGMAVQVWLSRGSAGMTNRGNAGSIASSSSSTPPAQHALHCTTDRANAEAEAAAAVFELSH